ncbi:hypothetical protein BKA62DRAFT_197352 [Auriculariales sp. MPI-PUGE-AT-0066]|nr:hypothetical protein BKA62DRAFT_197352 [Auriculariales sp. MPI-PUGE-AT-0066]
MYLAGESVSWSDPHNRTPRMSMLAVNGFQEIKFWQGAWGCSTAFLNFANHLTELCILEDVPRLMQDLLIFPHLQTLIVNHISYLEYIRAPSLLALTCDLNHKWHKSSSFAHLATVQHLTLSGVIKKGHIITLAQLSNISHLAFDINGYLKRAWPFRSYGLKSGVFSTLRTYLPPIWPLLERIYFRHVDEPDAIRAPKELIDFIGSRNNAVQVIDVDVGDDLTLG